MNQFENRLINETSPYLRQHARNPVDWYPWNQEALDKARQEGKPILLSIGYSACHWCHVMAHESFEDPATARVMNKRFVNIKVDREERPDLDRIYQTSQLLLNQRGGGWPLTMFLTPADQVPFFGGTYFPKEPRHGLPAFADLLNRIADFYRGNRAEIDTQNASMLQALDSIFSQPKAEARLDEGALAVARQQLEQSFDSRHGGFGRAPKFPHPTNVERLLRHWAASGHEGEPDERALDMAVLTLNKMALGGIYDHLGGGFCRYSVDDQWIIPHFEKMLYDNGPLLALCAQAAVCTGSVMLQRAAIETADWVMREMQSSEGGYYSSLDADSEGEEGKFYVWRQEEVQGLLEPSEYTLFARRYGLDRAPNFEGRWHLHTYAHLDQLAEEFHLTEQAVLAVLHRSRAKLLKAREQRVRPGRDEKILTSWNALMIKGMAIAGRHLASPDYVESATRALDFVRATLWRDGRVLATYKDGKAHLNGYLDDYAFLIDAVLELLQARWRSDELQFARELAEVLLRRFEDADHGGFYFTADDHEPLIQRPKTLGDEAMPAGNGIAAVALARLGYLVGEPRYVDAAERTLAFAASAINEAPVAHASLLTAFEERLTQPEIIIVRGCGDTWKHWHRGAMRDYAPKRLTFAIADDAPGLPPALAAKTPADGVVAYVCQGFTCLPPLTDSDGFEAALASTTAKGAGLNRV